LRTITFESQSNCNELNQMHFLGLV
jgi:hypothetical protein